MKSPPRGSRFANVRVLKPVVAALALLLACNPPASQAEEQKKKPAPCTEDAVVVFDASGSMSGNQTLGIPNSRPRIDEARSALAKVLPNATRFRRVGLVTYGPGPYNQCNVKLDLKPMPNAAAPIMSVVNSLVPAGRTAADLRHRGGRRGARFPGQARRHRGGDRWRGDLRALALRARQAIAGRGLRSHGACDRLPL